MRTSNANPPVFRGQSLPAAFLSTEIDDCGGNNIVSDLTKAFFVPDASEATMASGRAIQKQDGTSVVGES